MIWTTTSKVRDSACVWSAVTSPHLTPLLAQMASGLDAIHSILGPETPISNRDIKDALWNYFFDVESSVAFLLGRSSFLPLVTTSEIPFATDEQHKKEAAKTRAGGKFNFFFSVSLSLVSNSTSSHGVHHYAPVRRPLHSIIDALAQPDDSSTSASENCSCSTQQARRQSCRREGSSRSLGSSSRGRGSSTTTREEAFQASAQDACVSGFSKSFPSRCCCDPRCLSGALSPSRRPRTSTHCTSRTVTPRPSVLVRREPLNPRQIGHSRDQVPDRGFVGAP